MRVFISTTTFAECNKETLRLLRKKKIDYVLNPYKRKLTEMEINNILSKSSYVGLVAGIEPLTKQVLENAKSLRIISRVGVGLDNIDLHAAKRLKIQVYNTPTVLVDSVPELTIGLILCCLRRITSVDRNMRKKIWEKEMGLQFKDKILGLIGFGKMGKRVAQLAKAFGAKIVFCDIKNIKSKIAERVSLSELLKISDIISIHSTSKEQLITKKEILKMKKGVILINTSRGSHIDDGCLYNGLRSGKIGFAALDVYTNEPYCGKLLQCHNVVLTPHIGSYAKEARIKMELEATENLIKGLRRVQIRK